MSGDMQAATAASAAMRRQQLADRVATGTKVCSSCRELKALTDFAPNGRNARGDGRHGRCHACDCKYKHEVVVWRNRMKAAAVYRPAAAEPAFACCQGEFAGGAVRHSRACPVRPAQMTVVS
jgi:hypothetical protein